jgi:hypothetical protein
LSVSLAGHGTHALDITEPVIVPVDTGTTGGTGLAMRVQNAGSSIATASIGLRGTHTKPTRTPDEISVSPGYFLGYRTILEHDPYRRKFRLSRARIALP